MSLENQKCRTYLEGEGYLVAKVEHYNHHTGRTTDLFGFGDFLGVQAGKTILVQATSTSNFSKRMKKVRASDALPVVLSAGWQVWVIGFKKGQTAPDRAERVFLGGLDSIREHQ